MNPPPPRPAESPVPPTLPDPLGEKAAATFDAALTKTPASRDAYLAGACGDDEALAAEVRALLRAHEEAGDFLEPRFSTAIEAKLASLKPEEAGERVGVYKLLQQIGEGGFGVVWMAEQQAPVTRRVALKIIKLGMDTKEVVARFEQERQALAMMDHPNIARVFDAGATATGRPYFVMELVRGIKITDFCDQSNLSTTDRLQLFVAVCHAVQHAHQKGIIHRDLKPSNILVTLHDGVPVPKVIDFGVAKATQARLTQHTLFTQFEQMIGTPLYMSPEQAEMSGLDIDTRSDIYSLGVLLYELLIGRTPFNKDDLARGGLAEIRRIIREEEPPRPSTALSTMANDALTHVAQHRHVDAPKLVGLLRGDLDWIVMKALDKDRARRYDTANGFAADIQRHLHNQPVDARPPSTAYRIQKFVRRHRLPLAAAGAVTAALVLGVIVSTWQAIRAAREAERASQALADLRETAPAFAGQAAALAAKDDFGGAIQKLGYAIKLQPETPQYWLERAHLLRSQLRLEEAAADYRAAIARHASDDAARVNAEFCERVAKTRKPSGELPHDSLVALFERMSEENRPATELMPLARLIGREKKVSLKFWTTRLKALPLASDIPVEHRLSMRDDGLLTLDLRDTDITDLSPISEMPVGDLKLSRCRNLQSLEAIRSMPLRRLDLQKTAVVDLSPLRSLKTLEYLHIGETGAVDLAPLSQLPLREFRATRVRLTDLSPLRSVPLNTLDLGQTLVSDLSPLRGLPLRSLDLSYTPAVDFSPLSELPLEQLWMMGTRARDLEFVRKMPLKRLGLVGGRDLRNIRVLLEVKSLELLVLPQNCFRLEPDEVDAIDSLRHHPGIVQISTSIPEGARLELAEKASAFWPEWDRDMKWWQALRQLGIKPYTDRQPDNSWWIIMHNQQSLTDLSIFTGANISLLDVSGCRDVTDLSPIRELPLRTLRIANTKVADLSPIRALKLRNLWMAETNITALSPLRGMPLQMLYMDKCPQLVDVSPLGDIPTLQNVILPESADFVQVLRNLPNLRRLSYTYDSKSDQPICTAEQFWKAWRGPIKWLAALRRAEPKASVSQLSDGTWTVNLTDSTIDDISFLQDAPIGALSLAGTRVTSLHPLESMPLKRLRIDGTPVTDLDPLLRCTTLREVVLPESVGKPAMLKKLPGLTHLSHRFRPDWTPAQTVEEFWAEAATGVEKAN